MSKEGFNPYQAHQKRIAFIEGAVGEGVLDIKGFPISERDQNIALVYYLNEDITGAEVGKAFPKPSGEALSRERIRQISNEFLEEVRGHASPQLQSSHPLSELLARRLLPLRETGTLIKDMVEIGAAPKEISRKVGTVTLGNARATLGRRGVEIPLIHISYEDLKAKIEAEADDMKLQEILDKLTMAYFQYNVRRRIQAAEKVVVSLTFVLREAGFYPQRHLSTFAEKLKEKGIPVRRYNHAKGSKPEIIYWFVFGKHKERVIDALENDPDLQRFRENPVKLICGEFEGEMPTTTDAYRKRSKKYGTNLTRIIQEATGHHIASRGRLRVSDFLRGCPVPVFKFSHRYIYPLDRTRELKSFLTRRYEELQAATNS